MADREGATDQRQSDVLANIQQATLKGTRCFETDDVAYIEITTLVYISYYLFHIPSHRDF